MDLPNQGLKRIPAKNLVYLMILVRHELFAAGGPLMWT
jgi:hypothetical protein